MTSFFNESIIVPTIAFAADPDTIMASLFSDALIALCCFLIPLGIFRYISQNPDSPARTFLTLVAAAVFLNGILRTLEVFRIWRTDFFVDAAVRLLAAAISVLLIFYFWRFLNQLLRGELQSKAMAEVHSRNEKLQERELMMSRFLDSTLNREDRIVDLKKEVNELCGVAGLPSRYRE